MKLSLWLRRGGLARIINHLRYCLSKRRPVVQYGPLQLSVAATDRCNLRCDFCHMHSPRIDRAQHPFAHTPCPDVTFELFRDFVDRYPSARSVSIVGSGEPLLNRDFYRMVEYARARGLLVSSITNGVLLKDHLPRLMAAGPHSLDVSVNGHDAASFCRSTGLDAHVFHIVVNNTHELIATRNASHSAMAVNVSFVIDRRNYRDIPPMIALAEDMGADHTYFHQFLPSPVPGYTAAERCLFAKDKEVVEGSTVRHIEPGCASPCFCPTRSRACAMCRSAC